MQIETLEDVLKWTGKFHQHLAECTKHCSTKNESERSQMLLNYIGEHESHLERLVDGFRKTASKNALKTWCQEYIHKHPIIAHHHCQGPFANLNSIEIGEAIFKQHEQVIELYRFLRTQLVAPSVIELLDSLVDLEEHEAMQMSKSAGSFEDL